MGWWFFAAELKSPIKQLVALESGSWLAKTSDGLFKDGKPAESADRMDWERLAPGSDGGTTASRALDCLQGGEGWLTLRSNLQGCFGGSSSLIRVSKRSLASGSVGSRGRGSSRHPGRSS